MAMLSPGLARSHGEASASDPCGKAPSPRAVRRAGAWRAAAVALERLEFLGRDLFFSVGVTICDRGSPPQSRPGLCVWSTCS